MKTISFFVTGEPKGQPRPRAFAFRGRARVFDPGTAEGWKSQIAIAAKEAGITAFEGPVAIDLVFHFQRPKAHFNKSGLKPAAPVKWHTQKPDADNLAKAVMDALSTLGAWHDDRQVAELNAGKFWAAEPGCHVTIKELCL